MHKDRNKSGRQLMRQALYGLLLLAATTQPSQAYVDPGTGSMLIQMAIAGVAGALFFFRQLRMQFTSWFRRTILGRTEPEQQRPASTNDAD